MTTSFEVQPVPGWNVPSSSLIQVSKSTPQTRRVAALPMSAPSPDCKLNQEEEWTLEPAPPLFSRKHGVPPQVFGFPVTEADLFAWAVAHDLKPEGKEHHRRNAAWKALFQKLPEPRRSAIIWNEHVVGSKSLCVVLGSNVTAEDMRVTQDIEFVKKCYDDVDLGIRPGWHVMTRA